MAIESLMQQGAAFVDALSLRHAPTETTEKEAALEAKTPEQSDTVTISEEGRALAAVETSGESEKSDESDNSRLKLSAGQDTSEEDEIDQIISMLKQQIERLQEEIKELEQSDLPEKIKQTAIQDKQVMLMELNKQLANAMENKAKNIGQADGGGTRANGPGNSAATF
ncbi:MAG: hypothetical protein AB7E51_15810 [Pseudodesulfovibrio sp.]|uniref:hypothetical protein n=1 Tax=Pseudodesulfovibrio sp. TaxID=2035812 RepID=UPI003D145733